MLSSPYCQQTQAVKVPVSFTLTVLEHELISLLKCWYSGNMNKSDSTAHMQRCRAICYDGTQFSNVPLLSYVTRQDMVQAMTPLESEAVARAGKLITGWQDYSLRIWVGEYNRAEAGLNRELEQNPHYRPRLILQGKELTEEQLATMPEVRAKDVQRAIKRMIEGIQRFL